MKCKIHHRELVCLSCVTAKAGGVGGKSKSEAKVKATRNNISKALAARATKHKQLKAEAPVAPKAPKRQYLKQKTVWTVEKTRAFMKAHPDSTVRAVEIVNAAGDLKASAKIYAAQHLVRLEKNKEVMKMARGAYVYTPWRPAEQGTSKAT
jgi:hypothetical protein